jgi:TRAP-type uncharacterized transport system substrate-binding protein
LRWVSSKIQLANQLHANPYLAKPGEAPVTVYLSTCAVTGGFMHIYTTPDQNIFEKYVINVKHVVIRGGTNVNLAALGSGEVQFLSCSADSTTGAIAVGRDARLILSPRTIDEVRDTNDAHRSYSPF